jgi:hypothetical protein
MTSETARDPANPTPEELRETARAEGLAATEAETDPEYELEDDEDPSEPQ